jgi:hypothetical protein
MMMDREPGGRASVAVSCWDLKQIRDAVNALRAASPKSALADLVEEKLRAIEQGPPAPRREFPPARERRILG